MPAFRFLGLGLLAISAVGGSAHLILALRQDRCVASSSTFVPDSPPSVPAPRALRSTWKEDLTIWHPFGGRQVLLMIADRPEMALYGDRTGSILAWSAAKFGGKDAGHEIYWDDTPPSGQASSEMDWGGNGKPAVIRIRPIASDDGQPAPKQSFDRLWSCAVFELLNQENAGKYQAVYENCYSHTRKSWVRAMARVEFETVLAMRRFFRQTWEPWSRKHGHVPVRRYWNADAPSEFEEWLAQFEDPDEYPWGPYGTYYDEHIAHQPPAD